MAIINCPVCDKRISSAAKTCEFCKTEFGDNIDDEAQIRLANNLRFKKRQKYQNFSFLFVFLFSVGALIMYFGMTDQNSSLNNLGTILLSLGFIGYISVRILLFIHNRK